MYLQKSKTDAEIKGRRQDEETAKEQVFWTAMNYRVP